MATRVLIVDDDPGFRAIARGLLAGAGYEVVGEAGGAREARRAVADLAPDAVLLDVTLPDGDGVELATALTAGDGGPRVLLTSTDPAVAPAAAVRGCGARGFVAKTALAATDLRAYLEA